MRKVPVLTLVMAMLVAAPVMAQITNGIEIDNNNRIVGEAGGNIFYNGLAAGESLSSVVNLGLPGGGNGTPGGVTGAATVVSIASVSVEDGNRVVSVDNQGANMASAGGLTANLQADGSYTVSADADFAAPKLVSFGADGGAVGTTLLAAPATNIELADSSLMEFAAGTAPQGQIAYADGEATLTLAAGEGLLMIANAAASVAGEYATVSFNYNTNQAANVAAIGFDSGFPPNGNAVNYTQISGGNVEVGATKNVAVTLKSFTGQVLPAFQIINEGDADATVTISDFKVVQARPVTDYAVAQGSVSVSALADWTANILGQDVGAIGIVDGNLSLTAGGADNLANAYTMPAVPGGSVTLQSAVQGSADPEGDGFFALVLTDGPNTINAYVPSASLAADSFTNVAVSGTASAWGANAFFVVQAFGFDATVQSAGIATVGDSDSAWDPELFN